MSMTSSLLSSFMQMQIKNCGWMRNPPLVCAHGGDSTNAFPNTVSLHLCFLLQLTVRVLDSSFFSLKRAIKIE